MAFRSTSRLLYVLRKSPEALRQTHPPQTARRQGLARCPLPASAIGSPRWAVERRFSTTSALFHGCAGSGSGGCGCGASIPLPYDPAPALDARGEIPILPYDQSPLPASAPEIKGHIIIHPHSRSRPVNSWPTAVESISPLVSELASRAKAGGSLEGYGVSFSDGEFSYPGVLPSSSPEPFPDWNPHRSKLLRPLPGDPSEGEQFLLHIYTPGKMVSVGPLSLQNLDAEGPLADRIASALASAPIQSARAKPSDTSHIYVCAHGMRDCRCGVAGGTLIDTLRRAFYEENMRAEGKMKETRIYGISHIGGHKWAANAIIYPHGDWYGNLRPIDAGLLLRAAQAPATSRYDLTDEREKMVHWPRWRGRLGLDHTEMSKLYDIWGPPLTLAANLTPARRIKKTPTPTSHAGAPTSASEPPAAGVPNSAPGSPVSVPAPAPAEAEPASSEPASPAPEPPTDMGLAEGSPVTLSFRSSEGEWFDVPAKIGDNVMKVAKGHGLPCIEATCGGQLECATCHAYLAQPLDATEPRGDSDLEEPAPEEVLPPAGEPEDDMLDYAMGREPSSRLTCQLRVTPALVEWIKHGGRIQLPRF